MKTLTGWVWLEPHVVEIDCPKCPEKKQSMLAAVFVPMPDGQKPKEGAARATLVIDTEE